MHKMYQGQYESNGASNVFNDPGEWANLVDASVIPTKLASIFKIDGNNLINGLTMPDVFAAAFVEPVMWTNQIYDNVPRTSAQAQQWPQPSAVDAWQLQMVKNYQRLLIGAP